MCAVAALIGQWVSEAQSQEFVGASEISSSQGVEAMVHYAALRRAACLASLAKALARWAQGSHYWSRWLRVLLDRSVRPDSCCALTSGPWRLVGVSPTRGGMCWRRPRAL